MKDGQLVELPPEILAQFWKLTVAKLLDLTVTTALSFQSYSSCRPLTSSIPLTPLTPLISVLFFSTPDVVF